MSSSRSPSISLSPFHLSFSEAIRTYHKRTKNDLLFHPLASLFQSCNDPAVALSLLQHHAQVSDQPRISDEQLKSLPIPTLTGLYAISSTSDEGVGLVRSLLQVTYFTQRLFFFQVLSPEKAILVSIGVLLSVRIFFYFSYGIIVTPNPFRTHRRFMPGRTGWLTSSLAWGGPSIYFRLILHSTQTKESC